MRLQPAEHVRWVATSMADIQLRCEPAHNFYTASFVIQLNGVIATPAEGGKNWCWVYCEFEGDGSNQFDSCDGYVGGRWTVCPPMQQRPSSGYVFWPSVECHCLYQMGTGWPKQRWPFLLDRAVTPRTILCSDAEVWKDKLLIISPILVTAGLQRWPPMILVLYSC